MTPAEIVKALRFCKFGEPCSRCPVENNKNCINVMHERAADMIERLEKEKAALLEYTEKSAGCEQCANYRPRCDVVDCFLCVEDCPCKKCKHGSMWQWKGLEDNDGTMHNKA